MVLPLAAQEQSPSDSIAWKASTLMLLAAQSADTATTLRVIHSDGRELNLMGSRTLAVDWASTGALLTAGYFLRHHPRIVRVFTFVNFGLTAEHGYAAIHNARQWQEA